MLENKLWTVIYNFLSYPRNIGWCDTGGMQFEILIVAHHAKQSPKTDHSRHQVGPNPRRIIYQVKASVSGRSIVATQLWIKSITAQYLTRIAEGLCRDQVTGKNN
jgi:hypothetical protein